LISSSKSLSKDNKLQLKSQIQQCNARKNLFLIFQSWIITDLIKNVKVKRINNNYNHYKKTNQ